MNLLQDVQNFMPTSRKAFTRLCLTIALCAALGTTMAQVDNVMIYGTVKDLTSSRKLDDVVVTVYKNGAKLIDVPTNASGKYELNLDYGADYKIVVDKAGFVGKNIKIDTRSVPEEDRQGGHGMNIDFSMLTDLPGIDYSILNEPFGMAAYTAGTFNWDIEYTTKMRDAQARLIKEYQDLLKNQGDAEAKFAKLMESGEKSMATSDFKKAVENFSEALTLKPKDAIATAKLSDANMRLTSQEADKAASAKYDAVIKEADGLFAKKDYASAKTKYNDAIAMKETEAYPKQKVKEIEAILVDLERLAAEEKKAKELQAKYDAAVAAGDAAVKAQGWDQAIAKYTEASELKPAERYPKDQLSVVAAMRLAAEKKAAEEKLVKELEENYKAAIAAADAAFKSTTWDVATAKYTEALALKPTEKYPQDQLAAIIAKKAELEKKAEDEKNAKELQAKYEAAILAADASFKSADYDAAETKYNEALGLKAAEKYPKDQLVAITKKREELAKKAADELKAKELDAQYRALITEADAAFAAQDWDNATGKYTEASALKVAEKYPKDQLAAITARKAEAAKKEEDERKARELNERYDAAIADADKAFGKDSWEEAKTKYNEASAIKSAEAYPKDQLALISKKQVEAEAAKKQAELDAKYDASIATADAAFDKKDYTAAKSKYQEASGLKTAEKYPKDRIAEVDALVAAAAKAAEEEKKAAELEKRYNDLIKSADKFFDGSKFSEALNDYKDALTLKPTEAYPKERITLIEKQLDATAQAKAEEERLLREKQEKDKRYNDLITSADKAFAAKTYDKAGADYRAALEVKAEEQYPKDKLAEINSLLGDAAKKAEEDRLRAEREAAESAAKAEADRLAAEAAAAEKARLAELERQKNMAAEQIDAEYKELIAAGDIAFGMDDFDKARDKYTAALGVKPAEKYPKDKLAAIDAELARRAAKLSEAERLAAEKARLDEERRLKEAADAEVARLAAANAQESAEAERLRKEREAEEARLAAEERDRKARESVQELDARYQASIVRADEAMAAKDYLNARGIYGEASDIKPDETYPLAKIDQIDRLLAEQERLRLEAELAAQNKEKPKEVVRTPSTNVGSGQEDEAIRFMREAREREEAEKYDRIRKFRSDLQNTEAENADEAAIRRDAPIQQKERLQGESAQLYMGSDARRQQQADDLLAYQSALERAEAERRQRSKEARTQNYQGKLDLEQGVQDRGVIWDQDQSSRAREAAEQKEAIAQSRNEQAQAGIARNSNAREDVIATEERMDALEKRGEGNVEAQRRDVDAQKRATTARETSYGQRSADSRNATKQELDNTIANQPRGAADRNRSKLAHEYPEGVTEESYTEGNKVIIKRVVVRGNKADEYSKVIAKWGTFYFKNGQSITEQIWTNGTEG